MRMIYGSLLTAATVPIETRDLVEKERQYVNGMMAALSRYPWEAEGVGSLRDLAGIGCLGVHDREARGAEALLPRTGSLLIAADARLDNRPDLLASLAIQASERAELDDAGLILRAYRRWGADCAPRLLGDFAFVIWDGTAGRLFGARDCAGTRPFYYHRAPSGGRFVFSSDLLAMASHPEVPLTLDPAYVAAVLRTSLGQFQSPERSFYRSIEKLPPAHCLTVDAGGLRRWAYWQPGQVPERRYADERDYVEELRGLLRDAVACRMQDARPIGAHISGGLDSSSVAVMAHRILGRQGRSVTGFSWSPPLPESPDGLLPNDERKLVEAVRQAEGFPVRYTRPTPAQLLAHARRDITLQPTTTLQLEMAAGEDAAGLGIRTMLSGWGGDELPAFNGRGYFADLLRRGRWLTLQRELAQRRRIHGGGPVWKAWIASGLFPLLPTAFLRRLQPEEFPASSPLPACLRPDFAASLAGIAPQKDFKGRERPGVRRMQITLMNHGHLSYRMESWASFGASIGLTYAFPLLDRRLVEFALSIPDHLYFKSGWKRYLYRTAMDGILPDSLRWQKVKEDPAMAQAMGRAWQEAAGQLRADLLTRADNPYVDVEHLAAAMDAQERRDAAVSENEPPRRQERRYRQQMNLRRSLWLAYISPKAFL